MDAHSYPTPNLVASFPLNLAMTERPAFCFSDSPFSFSVSMLFYSYVKEEDE